MVDDLEDTIKPGFDDPLYDTQRTLALLEAALQSPGELFDAVPVSSTRPLNSATVAFCLTLLDSDTPCWLDSVARTPELLRFLDYHCGCPVVEQPQAADCAVVTQPQELTAGLGRSAPGATAGPNQTLIVQVRKIGGGTAYKVVGPNAPAGRELLISGLANEALAALSAWRHNARRPVDLLLTHGGHFIGLPYGVELEPTDPA